MSVPWLRVFGGTRATLAAMTSAGMIFFAPHWQKLEAWAYGDATRPWPVWALAGLLLWVLWTMGFADFAQCSAVDRSWAGWALVAGVPALWALKPARLLVGGETSHAISVKPRTSSAARIVTVTA